MDFFIIPVKAEVGKAATNFQTRQNNYGNTEQMPLTLKSGKKVTSLTTQNFSKKETGTDILCVCIYVYVYIKLSFYNRADFLHIYYYYLKKNLH